jgi:hypothetical protein
LIEISGLMGMKKKKREIKRQNPMEDEETKERES